MLNVKENKNTFLFIEAVTLIFRLVVKQQ